MDEKVKNFLVNSLIESSVMFFILLVFWFVYGKKYSSDIFFDNEGDLYLYTFIVSAVSSMCLIKLKEEDIKPISWIVILVFSGIICFTTYAISTESFGNNVELEYERLILLFLATLISWGMLQYKKCEYQNSKKH
jgi:hypothetical protein